MSARLTIQLDANRLQSETEIFEQFLAKYNARLQLDEEPDEGPSVAGRRRRSRQQRGMRAIEHLQLNTQQKCDVAAVCLGLSRSRSHG
jgi:hypothetical protein